MPIIIAKETIKLTNKLKNSNCTGYDDVCNKIVKFMLTYMILYTEIFPHIYKIFRILPLSKLGLGTDRINNFHPLNKLPAIKNILKTYILCHIEEHIKTAILSIFHFMRFKDNIPQLLP